MESERVAERVALLRELVRVPWRHRILALAVTAFVTAASLTWALAQPTVYTARSRILLTSLSPKAKKVLGVNGAAAAGLETLTPQTQAKLIGSSEIAGRVSRAIGGLISKEELERSVEAVVVSDNLIEIRAASHKAVFAQAEANAFAETYLVYRNEQNAAAVAAVTKQIAEQRAVIDARLAGAEHTIEQSAASLALLPPPEQSDTAQQAIRASLSSDQERATAERVRLTASRRELNAQQADLTGATGSPGQLVSRAALPRRPAGPGPLSIGLAGVLAGLMLGVAAAFLRDRLGERVGPEDEPWADDAPVLARLPLLGRNVANAAQLLVAGSPETGGSAETYGALREALAARGLGESYRILLVTSPGRREGKSATAANLAAALAVSGLHTIAVSADLRRPRLGAFFGVEDRPGLTDVLKGTATLTAALRSSGIPNLMVLPTAPEASTGSDLLATPSFARLLRALADEADVVVVDAAGFADGADAVILAGLCGASLLVVQDGVTLAGAAERAVQALTRAGAAPLGAVVSPPPPTTAPVRVAVAGLSAATVFLGSVVWASTASVREAGTALAYTAPSEPGRRPADSPAPVAPDGSLGGAEMSPEIRALWEAARAEPSPTPEPSPTAAEASPSPAKPTAARRTTTNTSTTSPSTPGSAPATQAPATSSPTSPSPAPPPPGTPAANHVPVAVGDNLTTTEDRSVAFRPLANDRGLEDGVLAIQITDTPDNGKALVNVDAILYSPSRNFSGQDTFRYTVTDVDGESSTATVTVAVTPVSDATPVAVDDDAGVIGNGGETTINVLANDHGLEDGVRITITRGPSNGTATVSDGKIVYDADPGKPGPDSFEYTITDSDGQTSTATVRIHSKEPEPEPSPSPSPEPSPSPSPDPTPTDPAPDPTATA